MGTAGGNRGCGRRRHRERGAARDGLAAEAAAIRRCGAATVEDVCNTQVCHVQRFFTSVGR